MAGLKVWTGTAWALKPVKVWDGSAWVRRTVKRWTGTAWAIVTGITSVVAGPPNIVGNGTSAVQSGSASVAVTGGSGSYSFLWSLDASGIGVTNATTSTATFTTSGMAPGETREGTAYCTVTDNATGEVRTSNTINLFFSR